MVWNAQAVVVFSLISAIEVFAVAVFISLLLLLLSVTSKVSKIVCVCVHLPERMKINNEKMNWMFILFSVVRMHTQFIITFERLSDRVSICNYTGKTQYVD